MFLEGFKEGEWVTFSNALLELHQRYCRDLLRTADPRVQSYCRWNHRGVTSCFCWSRKESLFPGFGSTGRLRDKQVCRQTDRLVDKQFQQLKQFKTKGADRQADRQVCRQTSKKTDNPCRQAGRPEERHLRWGFIFNFRCIIPGRARRINGPVIAGWSISPSHWRIPPFSGSGSFLHTPKVRLPYPVYSKLDMVSLFEVRPHG